MFVTRQIVEIFSFDVVAGVYIFFYLTPVGTKTELLSVSSDGEEIVALENGFDDDDESPRFFKWSTESTKLLLSLRFRKDSAFCSRKSKKKQLWDSVADGMYRIGGYRVSGVVCDLKFRNMMHTYKKNRIKENSGNPNIAWEYYKIFNDAVGHRFSGDQANNMTDSMLFEDTMMEAPNDAIEQPNAPLNGSITNHEGTRKDHQEDCTTKDLDTQPSIKRQRRENSLNDDDDCMHAVPPKYVPQPLTEDERNECTAFGNSVACQLLNINDSYSRALTRLKMQKILFLAQTGRLALNNERV